jgi:hypothetical protein
MSKPTLPPDTILAVVHDGHNMHCLTEGDLDEWFRSLSTDRKAALYQAELEGALDDPLYRPHPEAKSLEEHAARFLRDLDQTMKAPFLGFGERSSHA